MNLDYVLSTSPDNSFVDVRVDNTVVFNLAFKRYGLLSDHVYITMEMYSTDKPFPISALRRLRKEFYALKGYYFFCQIAKGDNRGAKWAEFFGFKYVHTDLPDRWHYEKDTT